MGGDRDDYSPETSFSTNGAGNASILTPDPDGVDAEQKKRREANPQKNGNTPDRRRRITNGNGSLVCFDSLTSEPLSAHHHVPCPATPPVVRPSVSLPRSLPLYPRETPIESGALQYGVAVPPAHSKPQDNRALPSPPVYLRPQSSYPKRKELLSVPVPSACTTPPSAITSSLSPPCPPLLPWTYSHAFVIAIAARHRLLQARPRRHCSSSQLQSSPFPPRSTTQLMQLRNWIWSGRPPLEPLKLDQYFLQQVTEGDVKKARGDARGEG
ncbi:hypothetical protein NMY22_g12420 [Coprinellus aureogranulatus]|nr:hypothetical protein NMY22_g12420 [Coprinellus aureogranulatus]